MSFGGFCFSPPQKPVFLYIFLFLFLLGKHEALEREAEGKVFDIFVLSPAVCIGREREHMAL